MYHHPSSTAALLGVLALTLQPQATTAFTASCIGNTNQRTTTRLTALQVDNVAAAVGVNDDKQEESSNDLFVLEDLEQQHLTWEVDMEALHAELDQQMNYPIQEKEKDDSTIEETTAPTEELVMEVQEVVVPPTSSTVEPLSAEETVILPVESTTLRAESETNAMLFTTNEALLELTAPDSTDMLVHLTAKLATAQRVIATVGKENQDMKQERGLLARSSSPAAKRPFRRLVGMLSRNKAKKGMDDDTMVLSEVTHDAIEIDSVLRLSSLVATAQRTLQTLLQENRDLKISSYYGASGISLVPAQGPEEVVTTHAAAVDSEQLKKKTFSRLFQGAASSTASEPSEDNVN